MNDRFFLDTNIFVYSFDEGSPSKAKRAGQLISQALETRKGVVSYQVVQEFFNVASRRFPGRMRRDDAEQFLSTVFRPLLAVHSSPSLYLEAIQIAERYRLPWYDALIVAGAIEAKCRVLYSEDFQDGQKFSNVEIRNPFL